MFFYYSDIDSAIAVDCPTVVSSAFYPIYVHLLKLCVFRLYIFHPLDSLDSWLNYSLPPIPRREFLESLYQCGVVAVAEENDGFDEAGCAR